MAFFIVFSVAVDGTGKVFVADYANNVVRVVVVATGAVTSLAGGGVNGTSSGRADGVGSAAAFGNPVGVATDGAGSVFVADVLNHLVRAVAVATGTVTTLAGGGSAGGSALGYVNGAGSAALFRYPTGVAAAAGTVFVADKNNNLIRAIVVASGAVTTLAGGNGTTQSGSANGVGTAATFNLPLGVAADAAGTVFVADSGNHLIRAIVVATGVVATLAGGGSAGGTAAGRVAER